MRAEQPTTVAPQQSVEPTATPVASSSVQQTEQRPVIDPSQAGGVNDAARKAQRSVSNSTLDRTQGLERPEAGRVVISAEPTGPIGSNQFDTVGGTRITTVGNADDNPQTTTDTVVPRDRVLYDYLTAFDPGYTQNVENMNHAKVQQQIRKYAEDNPQVMRRLGITDINHLTPRQAMLLSSQIAQDIIQYDHAPVAKDAAGNATPEGIAAAAAMDAWGVEEFFRPDRDGVCRTYAEIVQGIFIGLKEMQDPADQSLLTNTYCKQAASHNHAWNPFYTVQPNGEVMVSQVDATWNDNGRPGQTSGTDYTFGTSNVRDYYRQQALFRGTGNRPLDRFSATFDNGAGLWATSGSGGIAATEVAAAGGTSALSNAIDNLPPPLRVRAHEMLDADVKAALNTWRSANGKPSLLDAHPQYN